MRRHACWITRIRAVAENAKAGAYASVLDCAKEGIASQAVEGRCINDEHDRYISYAVDEEDWEDAEEDQVGLGESEED